MADILVKCTRCKNQHMESQRENVPNKKSGWNDLCCPRCGAKTYYDMSPQVAWCWASGLIEIGDALPPDSQTGGGAIAIASGPKSMLNGRLQALARHGQGASRGKLLVPGIPEADSEKEAGDALAGWLAWCAKGRQQAGVVFAVESKLA